MEKEKKEKFWFKENKIFDSRNQIKQFGIANYESFLYVMNHT